MGDLPQLLFLSCIIISGLRDDWNVYQGNSIFHVVRAAVWAQMLPFLGGDAYLMFVKHSEILG